jgi:hypothetical protein
LSSFANSTYCLSVILSRIDMRTQYIIYELLIYPCFQTPTYYRNRNVLESRVSPGTHGMHESSFADSGLLDSYDY